MAYRPSVYQTDPAFAQSVNNLSGALFGNPRGEAQYAAALGNQKVSAEQVISSRRNRGYLDNLSGAVRDGNLADALGFAAGTGDSSIMSQMPGYNLARTAADPEASVDDLGRLFVGTGQDIGPDTAFSVDQSEDRLSNAFGRSSSLYDKQYGGKGDLGNLTSDKLAAYYIANDIPLPPELLAWKRGDQQPKPITLDPRDLDTLDLLINDMAPDGFEMDPQARAGVTERAGSYYTNPSSPVAGDMAGATARAFRDVMGADPQESGNWNPFKSNRYMPEDNYSAPPLPWDQPQRPVPAAPGGGGVTIGGRTISMDDINRTAQNRGLTPEQVIQTLRQRVGE